MWRVLHWEILSKHVLKFKVLKHGCLLYLCPCLLLRLECLMSILFNLTEQVPWEASCRLVREPFQKLPSLSTPCELPSLHDCHMALVNHPLPCKRHRSSPPTKWCWTWAFGCKFQKPAEEFCCQVCSCRFSCKSRPLSFITLTKGLNWLFFFNYLKLIIETETKGRILERHLNWTTLPLLLPLKAITVVII